MRHTWRWAVALLACWLGQRLPAGAAAPPQTRPATLPALKPELAQKWRAYQAAWEGGDSRKLDAAEAALYGASGDRRQFRLLAGEMQRAWASAVDDGRRCRLAYMIFAIRAKGLRQREPSRPPRPDEKAMNAFLSEWHAARKERADTALWGFRVLQAAGGNIPDPRRRNDAFARAWAVMATTLFFCMPFVDDPAPLLARFEALAPKFAEHAEADPATKKARRRELKGFGDGVAMLARRAREKRAIVEVLASYRQAHNAKDDNAFVKVCSAMDRYAKAPASRPADRKTLADVTAPAQWTISLLCPYAIYVDERNARIEAFLRYRDKAGRLGPIRQKTFHADKAAAGWRVR